MNDGVSRIVAGGGGGASGIINYFDPGGFGGGLSGGNASYRQSLQSQGTGKYNQGYGANLIESLK